MTNKARLKVPRLTEIQYTVLLFVRDQCDNRPTWRWPGQRQIAAHLGVSRRTARDHIDALARKSCLKCDGQSPGSRGSISVTQVGRSAIDDSIRACESPPEIRRRSAR